MRAFVRVIDAGSFAGAAREMSIEEVREIAAAEAGGDGTEVDQVVGEVNGQRVRADPEEGDAPALPLPHVDQ